MLGPKLLRSICMNGEVLCCTGSLKQTHIPWVMVLSFHRLHWINELYIFRSMKLLCLLPHSLDLGIVMTDLTVDSYLGQSSLSITFVMWWRNMSSNRSSQLCYGILEDVNQRMISWDLWTFICHFKKDIIIPQSWSKTQDVQVQLLFNLNAHISSYF